MNWCLWTEKLISVACSDICQIPVVNCDCVPRHFVLVPIWSERKHTVDTDTDPVTTPSFSFIVYVFYYISPFIFIFSRTFIVTGTFGIFLLPLSDWTSALKNRLSFHRVYSMNGWVQGPWTFLAVWVRIPGEIPFHFIPRILTLIKSTSDSNVLKLLVDILKIIRKAFILTHLSFIIAACGSESY